MKMNKLMKRLVSRQVEAIAGRPLVDTDDGPLYVAFDENTGILRAGALCGNFGGVGNVASVEYDPYLTLDENLQSLLEAVEAAA